MCCLEIFVAQKLRKLRGVNSPQIYFKAVVRRELAGAEGGGHCSPKIQHGVFSVTISLPHTVVRLQPIYR